MNERIRLLAGKALDKAVPYTWHNLDHVEMEKVMNEFARLIVRECAEAVENSIWHLPRGYKAVDQAEFVKKHFGVEE